MNARKTPSRLESESLTVMLAGDLPSVLEINEVKSAQPYLILAHLVRPLVHLNKNAQVEGDLADSWEIKDDFRTYEFQISGNAKWSDGNIIIAEEIASTIEYQMRIGPTTHFDFRAIDSVEALNGVLKFRLKESNPNFLTQLIHPEFGPLYSPVHDGYLKFGVSAGPYYITERSNQKVVMRKNPYFPFSKPTSPDVITFVGSPSPEAQIEALERGDIDVVLPMTGISPAQFAQFKAISNSKAIDTHVGYTFWLAPNFNSPAFRNIASRRWLFSTLADLRINFEQYNPYWSKARQIFLNDGFGRPSDEELDRTVGKIKNDVLRKPKSMRLLVSFNFPFTNAVLEKIKAEGVEVHIDYYRDLAEFERKMNTGQFDVMQINNDFSSYDVLENLAVTFSSSRPLIAAGAELVDFQKALLRARQAQGREAKHTIIKELGLDLLRRGAIVPLAYRKNIIFASKRWDFSGWSNLFPDVRFWKIQLEPDRVERGK